MKVRAINTIYQAVMAQSLARRSRGLVVTLSATLCFVASYLFGRPRQDSTGRAIATAGSGLDWPDSMEYGQYLILNGVISAGPIPTLRPGSLPSLKVLQDYFSLKSVGAIQQAMGQNNPRFHGATPGTRPNQKRHSKPGTFLPKLNDVKMIVNAALTLRGIRMPDSARMSADDLDDELDDVMRLQNGDITLFKRWTMDQAVEGCFQAWAGEMWSLLPNVLRNNVLVSTFHDTTPGGLATISDLDVDTWREPENNIVGLFAPDRVNITNEEELWDLTVNRLFPIDLNNIPKLNDTLGFRSLWLSLLRDLLPDERETVGKLMKAKFRTLTMCPGSGWGKAWTTRGNKHYMSNCGKSGALLMRNNKKTRKTEEAGYSR